MAFDRATLFGLVVADKLRVPYAEIDPEDARKVFIREALVEGKYGQHRRRGLGEFFTKNQKTIEDICDLEAKSRRRDILVDDEIIYLFYDERLPEKVCGLNHFESWRKKAEQIQSDILLLPKNLLMQHGAYHISENAFPNSLIINGDIYPLFYHFDPGHGDDGVSIGVPASVLHTLKEEPLEWLVPGLLREKCIALVKGLPKQWRKQFVPVPDYVDKVLARMSASKGSLLEVLANELSYVSGVAVPLVEWQAVTVDDYYRMNIHVLDERGKVIDRGRHLNVLRERYRDHVQQNLQRAGAEFEQSQLVSWSFGAFSEVCQLKRGAIVVKGFPALCDSGDSVDLKVLDNPADAFLQSRYGVARLLLLAMPTTYKY